MMDHKDIYDYEHFFNFKLLYLLNDKLNEDAKLFIFEKLHFIDDLCKSHDKTLNINYYENLVDFLVKNKLCDFTTLTHLCEKHFLSPIDYREYIEEEYPGLLI